MRIVQLLVENFKNIQIADITPTGGTVIISGENGAGKTALIDAFWMALDRKGAIKDNPDPIKHGEEGAKVTVNLGKYIVTRTWTKADTYLKIENADGAVFKSPGTMLNSLIGELSFDPQAFTEKNEKDQLDTLINILDLPIDITALDKQRDDLYKARTLVNRDVSALKGQRDGIVIPDGLPDEKTSPTAVMDDYQTASDKIVENGKIRDALSLAEGRKAACEGNIVAIKEELAREEEDLAHYTKEVSELTTVVNGITDPNLEDFKCLIDDVENKNALIQKKQEKQVIIERLSQQETASENMTKAMEKIDAQKADAIKNASMPVPGLSFDETGVLYNGVKLKGCSAAEQLKVSIGIAMVLNPKIRVIRITDGSLLDDHNMSVIEEMAEKHDFQVWIERVDSSGKVGVFIREGEIVADNQAPAEPPAEDKPTRAQDGMPELRMPKV
jgi:DNA repair exonuclease SbcCD ATPase subunit